MKIIEKEDFTLSDSIGHVVNIVANKMKLELENNFENSNYDITALQWMALGIIYENKGITQNELAKKVKKIKLILLEFWKSLKKKVLLKD